MDDIRPDMDKIIAELKQQGVSYNTHQFLTNNGTEEQLVGLGDIVENVLNKFGVTQERFKAFFGLKECNCTERKKFLNNLFSWHVKRKEQN